MVAAGHLEAPRFRNGHLADGEPGSLVDLEVQAPKLEVVARVQGLRHTATVVQPRQEGELPPVARVRRAAERTKGG